MGKQYCTRQQMTDYLRRSHEAGRPVDELVDVAYKIADGLIRKYAWHVDADDARQQAGLAVLKCWWRLDVNRNPFAYMTTTVASEIAKLYRGDKAERKLLKAYAEEFRDELPRR